MSKCKDTLVELIVTCFFIGRIRFAPGTFGSLPAFPIVYLTLEKVVQNEYLARSALISGFVIISIVIISLFALGWICSSIYVKTTRKEDPKEVVIDEVVGQMIVIIFGSAASVFAQDSGLKGLLSPQNIDFCFMFLMPFILFRLFDIFKPWPIGWVDKNIHGGLGIMLDDVLAAVFAVVTQYFLTFIIIDWFV